MNNNPSLSAKGIETASAVNADSEESLVSFEHLCIHMPLYQTVKVTDQKFMAKLKIGAIQFDAYCIECEKDATFRTARSIGGGAAGSRTTGAHQNADWMLKSANITVEVFCQRNGLHRYLFMFRYILNNLTKYGQFPSLEDIAGADIRKYAKLLPQDCFGELKRATGLASHGIGIGAFVYLRRIFEKLIHTHHEELAQQQKSIEGFANLRMEEKIAVLKDMLPPALVEHRATYKILSTGIHELDEDTCRRYFPVVRQAIIAILEQDLQKRQATEQTKQLQRAIDAIASEVKAEKRVAPLGNSAA